MNTTTCSTPPTPGDIDRMARDTLKILPQELALHVTGVTLCAETFPDTERGQDLDLESPFDLPGYAA